MDVDERAACSRVVGEQYRTGVGKNSGVARSGTVEKVRCGVEVV